MNNQMAYLVGMILGNGEVQRNQNDTIVTIEIPHKNLKDGEGREVSIYVRSSLVDIRNVIEPLLGHALTISTAKTVTSISFRKANEDFAIREILRFIGSGIHHSTMTMNDELFNITTDEKKELLRGIADVTGYIRKSNYYYDKEAHRVYIEIPGNWQFVIDIANMLKKLDIPVQNINFGHPNFRDPNLKAYNKGKPNYWKKEHQIKIWANEFLPIGFNIVHKQRALEKYSKELLKKTDEKKTHRFYWETKGNIRKKQIHPMESDASLPEKIRGKHFDSWKTMAKELGYGE